MNKKRAMLGFFAGATLFLAFLYLYPPRAVAPVVEQKAVSAAPADVKLEQAEIPFTVLDKGVVAVNAKNRKNYAIYTEEEMKSFWAIAHGKDTSKEPKIDFKKEYVIAVFAGNKPSPGYDIHVMHVKDSANARTVAIALETPGTGCTHKDGNSSPYEFIKVPIGNESALTHTDIEKKVDCK